MSNISDFVIKDGTLIKYNGADSDVDIPDGITVIGSGAFRRCTNLKRVRIPDGAVSIEKEAFIWCGELRSVTIPDTVTAIGDYAFQGCNSLTGITLPNSLTSIGSDAFWGPILQYNEFDSCKYLGSSENPYLALAHPTNRRITEATVAPQTKFILDGAFMECKALKTVTVPDSVIAIGNRAFEDCNALETVTLPENMGAVKIPPSVLKSLVLTPKIWSQLPPKTQFGIYMTFRDRSLLLAYDTCISDYVPIGNELLALLSGSPSVKECNTAAIFMESALAHGAPSELLERIYSALKTVKTGKKAVAAVESNAAFMITVCGKEASFEGNALDRLMGRIMLEDKLTFNAVESRLSDLYGLKLSDLSKLPEVKTTEGETADPHVIAWLMTAHEELKKEYPQVTAGYKHPNIRPEASEVIALLDGGSLQVMLAALSETHVGAAGRIRKNFLSYPVCRYADEELMRKLTAKAPKWRSKLSGDDAPPFHAFRHAVIYSETRSAMLFADKYGVLDSYAEIRGTDADTVRDKYLSDVGLSPERTKSYDLGNQTVTVRLLDDLTYGILLPDGRSPKTLPKKGADTEKYELASKDFKEMQTATKQIVKNRISNLFEAFLGKKARTGSDWKSGYLSNPLLRSVARLLVWEQSGKLFTVGESGAVAADGSAVEISDSENVFLAHPMEMKREDVSLWQSYFLTRGLKQPFEQIWEPIIDIKGLDIHRYKGCEIPFYRFKDKKKHGIHVSPFDFYEDYKITFDGCDAVVNRIDERTYTSDINDRYEIESIVFPAFDRRVNHVLAYLDRITVYGRILKGDTSIVKILPSFTLAQIMDFIGFAAENKTVEIAALLMEYKKNAYPDHNPLDSLTLD